MIFRRKSEVVEANVFRGGAISATAIINWALRFEDARSIRYFSDTDSLSVDNMTGFTTAWPGDYVVRGPGDDFFACAPNVFEANYDLLG